ncbi:MAG TPA: ThiF family adenylyltransferase [Candidatus Cloacimonadota bacterium]|nr:ThiF family adenylyltransferase [Candidatus Cloacimonadota bacterium]HPT72192.1 ThiF family adenylyltransferase [Candidatus Cloacimonadota bacterium]
MKKDLKCKEFLERACLRSSQILSKDIFNLISYSKPIIFGVGGVGSVVCEQLVRMGVSELFIIDRDVCEISNFNRQIGATFNTVENKIPKVHAIKNRLTSLNPYITIHDYMIDVSHEVDFCSNLAKTEKNQVVFNCVDHEVAQINVATIAKLCHIPMIVGGVIGIGTDAFETVINPQGMQYTEIFKFFNDRESDKGKSSSEDEIHKLWYKSYKDKLINTDDINKDFSTYIYPVLTPLPWLIASMMMIEFYHLITGINNPTYAPNAVVFVSDTKKWETISINAENRLNLLPWRP